MGESVRLRFRQPHALSATARLEFLSRHRTEPSAAGILLMAESCVLGPKWQDHVVCREWSQDVVLFRRDERLFCRALEPLQIDGRRCEGQTPVAPGAHVESLDRGKTVAAFCMGNKACYEFLHDNPSIDFRSIDYTNNPLIIANQKNMTAINAALQIDLTGQATAESIGKRFYSGVGGQADFMRGTVLAPGGKTILAVRSTSNDGKCSRIVPCLDEGAGVTLVRGDIHYVVTEYGIVYLHGKNVRERAMDLISIAHPKFQPWLIEEAKKLGFIYRDQAFIPGKKGEYPGNLETHRKSARCANPRGSLRK